ncbi:MAG TPA: acyl-CoA thioesterase [Candidatus Stackebrandtia faecavium]|nr:acyl-CoA thioesterase [Candidatus Stackebrandtia faecavium]
MAKFSYECPVRWSDVDAFQHVNNVRFMTFFEEARVALMFTSAQEWGLNSFAEGCVVARHEVDYLKPVNYCPSVHIDVWVDEVRNSSFSLMYELFDKGDVACRSRSVLVPFDLAAGRARRVSESEREFLNKWSA